MRLDKLVVEAAPDWTRGAVQRAVRAGEILVDGKRAAPSFRASAGQRIEYQIKPPKAKAPKPESTPLHIVYEEADALVVNKPAGMTTHPAPGSESGTLANALLAHFPQIAQVGEPTRPGIVHRLDRGTSGLLAAAKTTRGYEALRPQFADHSTERQYCAVVYGSPPDAGVIDAPIGRSARNRTRFTVGGVHPRRAVTHFSAAERFRYEGADFALLNITLETGRTHQIRVHLSHIGFGVVGDPTYGGGSRRALLRAERQMLHAERLGFALPSTGERRTFRVDPPDDIQQILAVLRGAQPVIPA